MEGALISSSTNNAASLSSSHSPTTTASATPHTPTPTTTTFDTDLPTPSFVVDVSIARANATRMIETCKAQNLELRPHMKTHKTLEAGALQCGIELSSSSNNLEKAKIVVSTLAEAEFFAKGGFLDILYGVPIDPSKFLRAWKLHIQLPNFHVMVDTEEAVDALESFVNLQISNLLNSNSSTTTTSSSSASSSTTTAAAAAAEETPDTGDLFLQAARRLSCFLAVDASSYQREGVVPTDTEAVGLAQRIAKSRRLKITGIYSHSGNSYNCSTPTTSTSASSSACCGENESAILSATAGARLGAGVIATTENDVMVAFAKTLREQGKIDISSISIGATPSACSGISWCKGLELHPGNYVFFDRQQVASGSCDLKNIAGYVVSRILSRHKERGEFLIDAGSCAMHKDSGGLKDNTWGQLLDHPGYVLRRMTQEVAVVGKARRGGGGGGGGAEAEDLMSDEEWEQFPLGGVVRILPNHACMTAASHPLYYIVDGESESEDVKKIGAGGKKRQIVGTWTPCKFW